jgi:pimeloyl-ACP methyl ester carboxylesterase
VTESVTDRAVPEFAGTRHDVVAAGRRIEAWSISARDATRPTLVLLHEGLRCAVQWRDFPQRLAVMTGSRVVSYSRYGHGGSEPLAAPRTVRYMHEEALMALPELLDRLAIADPVLIGHSDGASIAMIHAGGSGRNVRGLVLMAPHVLVEDVTVASIAAVREAYQKSDLRERMARYHLDPDATFRGWNDIWLDPAFRAWNIEEYLPAISCPVLMIQGLDDEYGTTAQLEAIEHSVATRRVERLMLAACGHAPDRDQTESTLSAIARFVTEL